MQLTKHIVISPQPDDVTCGPTCLHAVYNHLGIDLELSQVIESVDVLEDGGTLAVMLGIDALKRGLYATIVSYNLKVFDPSWNQLSKHELIDKLDLQLNYKHGKKFTAATKAYQQFLRLGGNIVFDDLREDLLERYFSADLPVLAGLSATYLYGNMREYANSKNQVIYHDVKGEPSGHFVVLCGMKKKIVYVSDPYKENPFGQSHYYEVEMNRLINAIMLGILTYDANLLVVSKGAHAF